MLWEVDRGLGLFKLRGNQRFPIKAFPLSFNTLQSLLKTFPYRVIDSDCQKGHSVSNRQGSSRRISPPIIAWTNVDA